MRGFCRQWLWGGLAALACAVATAQVLPQHWPLSNGTAPYGLLLDAKGQVHVSLFGSDAVVRFSAQGEPTLLGRTGSQPMGLALDGEGNVYVANFGDDTVSRITPSGESTVLGRTGRNPSSLVFDAVRRVLYVTDTRSDTVTRLTLDGQSSTLGKTGQRPMGIALDAQGNVYTADHLSNTVTRLTPEGQSKVLGSTGQRPFGIAVDAQGHVYTANHGGNSVTRITPAGASSTLGPTGLHPFGIALDAAGHVYTSNYDDNTVSRITAGGQSALWGSTGLQPMGIAVNAAGEVHVANYGANSVTRLVRAAAPAAPRALRAEATETGVALDWQAPVVPGSMPVLDYVVEYRAGRQGPWRVFDDGVSTAPQATVTGLPEGVAHEFRVSAVNWVGAGAPHAPVAVTLPVAKVPAPLAVPAPAQAAASGDAQAVAPVAVAREPQKLPPGCAPLLLRHIRAGLNNDAAEVNRLVAFLDSHEGEGLAMDGTYDEDDVAAVKRFQRKHAQYILAPFGIAQPTGVVSVMTREKINSLHCAGKRTVR